MCLQETEVLKVPNVKAAKAVKLALQYKIDSRDVIGKALNAFLNTSVTAGKFDRYHIDGDFLVYRAPVTDEMQLSVDKFDALLGMIKTGSVVLVEPDLKTLKAEIADLKAASLGKRKDAAHWDSRSERVTIKFKCVKQDIVAKRIVGANGTLHVGNSSMLGLIGRYVSFGNEQQNRAETEIQARLSRLIPMVPFSVFEQADLDLNSMRLIARGTAETVTRKRQKGHDRKGNPVFVPETVHFTGASLFDVGGECFLFDIDRREIEHEIFNPFLVKLPRKAQTIAAAYEMLKPDEVKAAELKGVKVQRQGEWYFLPIPETETDRLDRLAQTKGAIKEITLQAGRNRPNVAQGMQVYRGKPVLRDDPSMRTMRTDRDALRADSLYFCKGRVRHSGREHADLMLKGWYRAVPNTATESFTITGDID